jgi:hypothetical protein
VGDITRMCMAIYSYPPACLKFNKSFASLDVMLFLGIADEMVHKDVHNVVAELPIYIAE